MAGESRITIGIGYSFDGSKLRDSRGYFDGSFEDAHYFDREQLQLVEPFHGVESDYFAVLAKSTVRSGDPQEWEHSYGIQSLGKITVEEFEAFAKLHSGLQKHFPELSATVSELGPIVSITADI